MSLNRSANGTFTVLRFEKRPVQLVRATMSAELLGTLFRSKAFAAQVPPKGQIREFIDDLLVATFFASCHAVLDSFVLDPVQPLLDQMMTDGPETNACFVRDFSHRQATHVQDPNRIIHECYLKRKQ
jgi:hypothetical protein